MFAQYNISGHNTSPILTRYSLHLPSSASLPVRFSSRLTALNRTPFHFLTDCCSIGQPLRYKVAIHTNSHMVRSAPPVAHKTRPLVHHVSQATASSAVILYNLPPAVVCLEIAAFLSPWAPPPSKIAIDRTLQYAQAANTHHTAMAFHPTQFHSSNFCPP